MRLCFGSKVFLNASQDLNAVQLDSPGYNMLGSGAFLLTVTAVWPVSTNDQPEEVGGQGAPPPGHDDLK